MSKYLILGGDGQLGQALRKQVKESDTLVFPAVRCDITDFEAVRAVIDMTTPDAVINCAAYTAVDKAEDDVQNALAVNAYGAANIAKLCCERGIAFVHISTDYVFDGSFPGTLEATPNPLNVYGYTKLFGEQLVRAVHPGAVIIRTASVYSEFGNNFLKSLLGRYNGGQHNFDVVCDHYSCPTYAPDLADTIYMLLSLGVSSTLFHYAGKDYISWEEFAKRIFSKIDPSVKINPVSASYYNSKAQRPSKSYLDTTNVFKPQSVDRGIEETLTVLLNRERE